MSDPDATELPMVLPLTDTMTVSDLLRTLALARFADGSEPWCRDADLKALPVDADLTPFGSRIERQLVDVDREVLVRGDGWTMLVQRWSSGRGRVIVTSVDEQLAEEVAQAILKQDVRPTAGEDRVHVGFWTHTSHGPSRRVRRVRAPAWHEIRPNYSSPAATGIDELLARTSVPVFGRLVLLHGPPGTGKSTVLRALAREWASWCRTEHIVDPERLFGDSSYLLNVLLEEDSQRDFPEDDGDKVRPGRLLVLEDCDELIRAQAKDRTGQALSRLLNVTDGLIGDGLGILVCITTNERLDRLHPAVVRPGRCLANIEVPPLSRAEAAAWLDGDGNGLPASGATLAELYVRRGRVAKIEQRGPTERHGLYL